MSNFNAQGQTITSHDVITQSSNEQTNFPAEMTNDTDTQTNSTDQTTVSFGGMQHPLWAAILIIIACTLIMVGTVVGNLLVCTAVSIVRKLRTPSNWLIVSLAVSDLLVALIVMPLATMYEIKGQWVLGQPVCDMWTSLDVMLCTASILNLCMISVDRYFVISRPFEYAIKRTPPVIAAMIISVWVLAALISIPPIFGWKDSKSVEGKCELTQAIGYQIYATLGAFYLPLIIMIIIYYRIYVLSSRLHKAEARSKPSNEQLAHRSSSLHRHSTGSKTAMENSHLFAGQNRLDVSEPKATVERKQSIEQHGKPGSRQNSEDSTSLKSAVRRNLSFFHRSGFHRVSVSKERKATKTLGVIMGAFTACWLPFFIHAVVRPCLSDPSVIPNWLVSLLQWLGFVNSLLNPIIYARFNREFRTPFKEILFGRCFGINNRLRSESYTEQFGNAADGPASLGTGGAGSAHRTVRHPGSGGSSLPETPAVFSPVGLNKESRLQFAEPNNTTHT